MKQQGSNIKDVARRAGVSIATVSNVLNHAKNVSEETRARVQTAIDGLKYVRNEQARSLRVQTNTTVYLIALCPPGEDCPPVILDLITAASSLGLDPRLDVNVRFFAAARETEDFLKNRDFLAAFLLKKRFSREDAAYASERVFLLDFCTTGASDAIAEATYMAPYLTREIDRLRDEDPRLEAVISYNQRGDVKPARTEGLVMLKREIGACEQYLGRLAQSGQPHRVLICDEVLAAGAVQSMLRDDAILYANSLSVELIRWQRPIETFGLPLPVHSVDVVPILNRMRDMI